MALVVINYAPDSSQCYVPLPFPELENRQWQLNDLLSEVRYDRSGNDLTSKGHFLDMPAWDYHVFEIENMNS